MSKFTGKNREIARWLGEPPEDFNDPGFCLGCGEVECECADSRFDDNSVNPDPPVTKQF